jgi:hypothetical protein
MPFRSVHVSFRQKGQVLKRQKRTTNGIHMLFESKWPIGGLLVAFTGLPFLHVAAMPNLDMDDQLSLDAQG